MAKVKVVQPNPQVKVRLTPDEAAFLRDLLERVGGHPENSLRAHANSIRNALLEAGICSPWSEKAAEGKIHYLDFGSYPTRIKQR